MNAEKPDKSIELDNISEILRYKGSACQTSPLRDRLLSYLDYENAQLTQLQLNEAIINELIFEVYNLGAEDRIQVETKMGRPVGQLPVLAEAVNQWKIANGELSEIKEAKEFVNNLPLATFEDAKIREIKNGLTTLYQSNNDLEEFCIRHQINPINVWYWFKEANVLPQARAAEIALEFLADAIRTVLVEDDDGIIPLVGLPGEPRMIILVRVTWRRNLCPRPRPSDAPSISPGISARIKP